MAVYVRCIVFCNCPYLVCPCSAGDDQEMSFILIPGYRGTIGRLYQVIFLAVAAATFGPHSFSVTLNLIRQGVGCGCAVIGVRLNSVTLEELLFVNVDRHIILFGG